MGENGTSGESDRIDCGRRRALALLGLTAAAVYSAPVLLNLHPALAQGDGGDGDGGTGASGDGHGSGDDGGQEGDLKGPRLPPEAP
jgi:hypothetical protein